MKHEIKKEISYDGILKEESEYLSEEKLGKSKEYYHGEWKAEGNYSEGKKDGIWLIKNYNGKVRKVLYINGIEQELEQEKINNILKPQKIKYEIPKVFILLVLMSIITIFTLILWEENNNLQKRLEKENVAERIFDFPEPYLKTKEE